MTEAEREQERLRYIRDSIALVEQYTRGGHVAFQHDTLVQDAVLRRLETLADASHRLTDTLKARHPKVSWQQIWGFRNVLAHAYEAVRLETAWRIVVDDLPALKAVADQEFRG